MKIVNKSDIKEGDLTVDKLGDYIGEVPERIGIIGTMYSTQKDLENSYRRHVAKLSEEQVELGRS